MRDQQSLLTALMIFLAAGTLAFTVMAVVRVRGAVKRRTERVMEEGGRSQPETLAALCQPHGGDAAHRIHHQALRLRQQRHHESAAQAADPGRHLRSARASPCSSSAAPCSPSGLAAALFVLGPMVMSKGGSAFWLVVVAGGIAGYVGPSMYIDKRIKARRFEHRMGFPDFMDLLVVCADSGLSMEASLERVGRELGDSYPSLTANIHMTNLEIRAGRNLKDALERFANRLALDEARAFATLINQSIDIGSSITDALRVYSDDMRHKRLSYAEEKAYALPAKLSVPMMVCIFPVLFVVILLPVFVRLHVGHYF